MNGKPRLLSEGVEALARELWSEDVVDEGALMWEELDEFSKGESRARATFYLQTAIAAIASPKGGPQLPEQVTKDAPREGSVTIYRKLMEAGTDEPKRELRQWMQERIEALTGDLSSELVEQLRQAYVAGVADGYRQAVMESER